MGADTTAGSSWPRQACSSGSTQWDGPTVPVRRGSCGEWAAKMSPSTDCRALTKGGRLKKLGAPTRDGHKLRGRRRVSWAISSLSASLVSSREFRNNNQVQFSCPSISTCPTIPPQHCDVLLFLLCDSSSSNTDYHGRDAALPSRRGLRLGAHRQHAAGQAQPHSAVAGPRVRRLRQGRALQRRRQRQGPDSPAHGRGGREERPHQTRRHPDRAHER